MSEEIKETTEETVKAEETVKVEEAVKAEEPVETMEDFARELEASYREYDERSKGRAAEPEGPDAEKWTEFARMMEEKAVSKVKVKEAVKGGLVAYLDDVQGFIPASQISTKYVEKLEDMVGQTLEVVPITVNPEKHKLVLSGKAVMKEREEAEKAEKLASLKVGAVVEGTVDSIKDYGAFVDLDGGLTGLLHVSQISAQRIKNPGVVLKEGQKVTVKVIGLGDGRISLSMKALNQQESEKEEIFHYKETGSATTGLGSLLKGIKL